MDQSLTELSLVDPLAVRATLWSIYMPLVSGQFDGESSLLRVLQSPFVKPKASYPSLPLLLDNWGTYSIAGHHHYCPTP